MLHLIHPALVHFSVAFIVAGGVVEIAGLAGSREVWRVAGQRLLIAGLLSLIPTIVSGYLAANTVELAAPGHALLDAHERNGLILLGLLFASQFWKAWCQGRFGPLQVKLYTLLVAAAVGLTVYSAWLGGRMVYLEGVGVLSYAGTSP